MMMQFPLYILWFVPLNVALHILAAKWGIVAMYQAHRPGWMPAGCNFCLYFWMAFFELAAVLPMGDYEFFIYWLAAILFFSLCLAPLSLALKPGRNDYN